MIKFYYMRDVIRPSILVLVFGYTSLLEAREDIAVTIKGEVYAGIPCEINKNAVLSVPFGDVQINNIDGRYKTIPLDYSLDCSRSVTNELRMQVRGTSAVFDPSVLGIPGYSNIGIALKKDGSPLGINTWSDFDSNRKPLLQAVLVKHQDSEIEGGVFRSSATLVVDYR